MLEGFFFCDYWHVAIWEMGHAPPLHHLIFSSIDLGRGGGGRGEGHHLLTLIPLSPPPFYPLVAFVYSKQKSISLTSWRRVGRKYGGWLRLHRLVYGGCNFNDLCAKNWLISTLPPTLLSPSTSLPASPSHSSRKRSFVATTSQTSLNQVTLNPLSASYRVVFYFTRCRGEGTPPTAPTPPPPSPPPPAINTDNKPQFVIQTTVRVPLSIL